MPGIACAMHHLHWYYIGYTGRLINDGARGAIQRHQSQYPDHSLDNISSSVTYVPVIWWLICSSKNQLWWCHASVYSMTDSLLWYTFHWHHFYPSWTSWCWRIWGWHTWWYRKFMPYTNKHECPEHDYRGIQYLRSCEFSALRTRFYIFPMSILWEMSVLSALSLQHHDIRTGSFQQ